MALAIFAMVTGLLLDAIDQSRSNQAAAIKGQAVLNVAQMAVQTGQNSLIVDGVQVTVERDKNHIRVLHEGEEVLRVEKK